jgi:hypothetical protein
MADKFRTQELEAPKTSIIHTAAPLEMTKQQALYDIPKFCL